MAHMKHFEHLKISLEAIKSATNDFSNEKCIGEGGFGKVYKGEIVHSMGKRVVALKRLNRKHGQGDPEFWMEVRMLSAYKHENIISLLGYCDDSGEKILVYEYAPKRSLESYLHKRKLSWVRRLYICIGVARGLMYLHNGIEAQQRVLHRDIKSSNILLDENWNAKISDFGLSKLGPANQQITELKSITVVGTPGYVDPLYLKKGLLTKESDVYSFGVMLFEVLCGRLCNNDKYPPLVKLAQHSYERNTLNEIIYAKIKDEISSDSLKMFTTIAYQCLMRDRIDRPLMTEVVKALEDALLVHGLDHHVGTLNVKVLRIMNLKRILWLFERPSFVKVGLTKDSLPSKKTNSITSLNPEWNEEFSLVLKDLDVQALKISVWEGEDSRNRMWMNVVPLKDLITEQQKTLTLDLSKHADSNHLENNNSYGQLIIELTYKPLTCEEVLTISEEAKEMNMSLKVGGWLVVTIIEAEDIQVTHPFVYVTIQNDKKQTKLAKKSCDPVWNEEVMFSFEKPPTNEILNLELHSSSKISEFLHETKRGHVDISLEDVVKKKRTKEMYQLEDTLGDGRLHVELQWRTSFS